MKTIDNILEKIIHEVGTDISGKWMATSNMHKFSAMLLTEVLNEYSIISRNKSHGDSRDIIHAGGMDHVISDIKRRWQI